MSYQRIVSKGPLPFHYMKIELEFQEGVNMPLTEPQMMFAIQNALKVLYGEVGRASVQCDILKYQAKTRSAIVRVVSSGFVQLWSALTLYGKHNGEECAFRVHQVSPHLIGLAVNSRTYQHQVAAGSS